VALDTDFHEELMKASHNGRLPLLVSNLREQIQRFRLTSLSHPGRVKLAVAEHRKIVDAIAGHDSDRAQNLAYEHIENAENSLMEVIREAGKTPPASHGEA
jgi:DNA-binding FadR family transcriptional regulator